ncbi:MAG TPA: disulfide bond formation protein B [Steroidobacteraceae bacterium]|nr:disulfide bond formation protein B [Steroidobacteraceae bacterium]
MNSRLANSFGFLVCVGLLCYAYFAQYVLHLDPCPLCIFQRVGIFATGAVFLAAAAHAPRRGGRRVYAALLALTALATSGVAVRQLYIQSLPPDAAPTCGASLRFMLQVLPLKDVLVKVLAGSGECAKIDWRFLGLAMPAWVLISAAGLGAFGVWANTRRWTPILRF